MPLPKANPCKECGKEHYAKGLCHKHYMNMRYKTIPEHREKAAKKTKEWKKEHPEKVREYNKKEYKKRPKGFKNPACPEVLKKDFEAYLKRVRTRGATSKQSSKTTSKAHLRGVKNARNENEETLKRYFVESVNKVINGGMELKVAKKLGIKYKEQNSQ